MSGNKVLEKMIEAGTWEVSNPLLNSAYYKIAHRYNPDVPVCEGVRDLHREDARERYQTFSLVMAQLGYDQDVAFWAVVASCRKHKDCTSSNPNRKSED